jgi:small subunit ribosomal protein S6
MRPYEVMIILEPTLEEADVQAVVNRSTELLNTGGASVERVDKWGKRRFAYEMKKRLEGYYLLLDVKSEPAAMAELDRTLTLADDVLRHKIVRIPDHVASTRSLRPASTLAPTVERGSDRDS